MNHLEATNFTHSGEGYCSNRFHHAFKLHLICVEESRIPEQGNCETSIDVLAKELSQMDWLYIILLCSVATAHSTTMLAKVRHQAIFFK